MGIVLPQEKDPSVSVTPEEFTGGLKPIPTSPKLGAGRQRPLSSGEIKLRQRKLGELC